MNRWDLIHFTDIHYGNSVFEDTKGEHVRPELRDDLRRSFLATLNTVSGLHPLPDALLITGDTVATATMKKGVPVGGDKNRFFDELTAHLRPIVQQLIASGRIACIVPGNHDVEQSVLDSDEMAKSRKFDEFLERVIKPLGVQSCLYPEGGDKAGNLRFREVASGGPLIVDDSRRLIVLAINSAMRCCELNANRYKEFMDRFKDVPEDARKLVAEAAKRELTQDIAQITQAQYFDLDRRIARLRNDLSDTWHQYLRVALLHHHLITFEGQVIEYKAYEPTVDAHRVKHLLAKYNFHLVLTGHKHQAYCEKVVVAASADQPATEILVAGGPTMLGSGPFHGFRRIVVNREDGATSLKIEVREIPLRTSAVGDIRPESEKSFALNIGQSSGSEWYKRHLSLPMKRDDEWMLFAKVLGDRGKIMRALDSAKMYLNHEVGSQIRFVSRYMLYGRWDILVRFALAADATSNDEIVRRFVAQVNQALAGDSSPPQCEPPSQLLKIREVIYLGPEGRAGHFIWSQRTYDAEQMQRAFAIIERADGRNINPQEWGAVVAAVQAGIDKMLEASPRGDNTRSFWTLHRADSAIVIEGLFESKYLRDVSRIMEETERLFDAPSWRRSTHIGYDHYEFTLRKYKAQVDEARTAISDHRLVKSAQYRGLGPEQLSRWLCCTGEQCRLFSGVLKVALELEFDPELKAILQRNYDEEIGVHSGKSHHARYAELAGLLRCQDMFQDYQTGEHLQRMREPIDSVRSSRRPGQVFGYVLVCEASITPILQAAQKELEDKHAEISQISKEFFADHTKVDVRHVKELMILGDQLPLGLNEDVEAGISRGKAAFLAMLDEAFDG